MPSEYTMLQAAQGRLPILKTDSTPGYKKIAIDKPVCVIGARSRVHLPLPSQLVSKAHAMIIRDADGVYLRDLASRNKTFVNERAVRETRLRDHDIVRFGPFTFECHSGFSMTADAEPRQAGELRFIPERGEAKVISLNKQTFLIGCRYSCDLMLTGSEIGLAHAIIFEREGKRYVRDLNSPGGTLLNEQAVREAELAAGDEIRIGSSRILYNSGEGSMSEFSAEDAAADHPNSLSPDQLVSASAGESEIIGSSPSSIALPWEDSPMVYEVNAEGE